MFTMAGRLFEDLAFLTTCLSASLAITREGEKARDDAPARGDNTTSRGDFTETLPREALAVFTRPLVLTDVLCKNQSGGNNDPYA